MRRDRKREASRWGCGIVGCWGVRMFHASLSLSLSAAVAQGCLSKDTWGTDMHSQSKVWQGGGREAVVAWRGGKAKRVSFQFFCCVFLWGNSLASSAYDCRHVPASASLSLSLSLSAWVCKLIYATLYTASLRRVCVCVCVCVHLCECVFLCVCVCLGE